MRLLTCFFQNRKGAISHDHERAPILRVHEPSDDDDDREATGRHSAFATPRRPSSSSSSSSSNEESVLGNVEALVPHAPSSCEATDNVENLSRSVRQVATDSQVYTHRRGNFGLLFITLAQLCFSIMNLLVKVLHQTQDISAFQIIGVETLIAYIGIQAAMLYLREHDPYLGPRGTRALLVLRGICGFLSTLALYLGLQVLSLGEATSIFFLSPLMTGTLLLLHLAVSVLSFSRFKGASTIAFLAHVFLHEPLRLAEVGCGLFSLLGIVFIARTEASLGDNTPRERKKWENATASQRIEAVLFLLMAVITTSTAFITIRKLGRETTWHNINYFSLSSWVCAFASMPLLGVEWVWPDSTASVTLLLLIGVFSLAAQILQTLELQHERAGRAATLTYSQLIFAYVWQVTILGDGVELMSVYGIMIILTKMAVIVTRLEEEDLPACEAD